MWRYILKCLYFDIATGEKQDFMAKTKVLVAKFLDWVAKMKVQRQQHKV